jgi:hypothetical protein
MPPNTSAQWIWSFDARNAHDFSALWFRKTFVAPAGPISVHVAVDDVFTAYVDGVAVTSGTLWFTPGVATVSNLVAGQTYVLGVAARNNGGSGGLVADVRATAPVCVP